MPAISTVVANRSEAGASTVYGVNYRFLQKNLETKLGQAEADNTLEGQIDPQYANMTGREFVGGSAGKKRTPGGLTRASPGTIRPPTQRSWSFRQAPRSPRSSSSS